MNKLPRDLVAALQQRLLAEKQHRQDQLKEIELVLTNDGMPPEDVNALVPEEE